MVHLIHANFCSQCVVILNIVYLFSCIWRTRNEYEDPSLSCPVSSLSKILTRPFLKIKYMKEMRLGEIFIFKKLSSLRGEKRRNILNEIGFRCLKLVSTQPTQ